MAGKSVTTASARMRSAFTAFVAGGLTSFRYVTGIAVGTILLLSFALSPVLAADAHADGLLPGPVGASESGPRHRQLWFAPSGVDGLLMRVAVERPSTGGKFPIAVVNHGSSSNSDARARQELPQYDVLSSWLIARGYAVVMPQRPGHGETGGPYLEDYGDCDHPNYLAAGLGAARSIDAAVTYFLQQPFARSDGVILIGHSAGAWGALALASRRSAGISAVIDFAGGLGGRSYGLPHSNCAPDRLVETAAVFGSTSLVPTQWVYAQNDSFFDSDLSRRMADSFRAAGGWAEYHLLPPIGDEGHYLMELPGSAALWGPLLEGFLKKAHPRTP